MYRNLVRSGNFSAVSAAINALASGMAAESTAIAYAASAFGAQASTLPPSSEVDGYGVGELGVGGPGRRG